MRHFQQLPDWAFNAIESYLDGQRFFVRSFKGINNKWNVTVNFIDSPRRAFRCFQQDSMTVCRELKVIETKDK